jgi:hypothetical protein
MSRLALILFLAMSAQYAVAEVTASAADGFSLSIVMTSKASPAQAFEAFAAVNKWWDPDHSYSGDVANLSLQLRPRGLLIETLPAGGFVRHLEVAYVKPGVEVRLLGGLGPLQGMGLHGALSMFFKPHPQGSEITMLYNVSGFSAQSLADLAPVVDAVQTAQMKRLVAYANSI